MLSLLVLLLASVLFVRARGHAPPQPCVQRPLLGGHGKGPHGSEGRREGPRAQSATYSHSYSYSYGGGASSYGSDLELVGKGAGKGAGITSAGKGKGIGRARGRGKGRGKAGGNGGGGKGQGRGGGSWWEPASSPSTRSPAAVNFRGEVLNTRSARRCPPEGWSTLRASSIASRSSDRTGCLGQREAWPAWL